MIKHHKLDYNKITKYIYIGTNMCCHPHFDKELIQRGIKADISLEKERLDAPFGVDYFIWLPTRDSMPSSQNQLFIGATVLTNLVARKIKTYVHCKNGHGRAPTLVAAYLILNGYDIEEALRLIESKRPVIHPNKSQIKALHKFKKLLKF